MPFDYLDKHSRIKDEFMVLLQEAAHGQWNTGSPKIIVDQEDATTLFIFKYSFRLVCGSAHRFRRQPSADVGAQATRRGRTSALSARHGRLLAANEVQPR